MTRDSGFRWPAAIAAAALLVLPLHAGAVTENKVVTYKTAYYLVHPMTSAGEYLGTMTLHFYPDGRVNGTYREEYAGPSMSVAGGMRGSTLWLSFAPGGARQLNATIDDGGVITGSLRNWHDQRVYKFVGVPEEKS